MGQFWDLVKFLFPIWKPGELPRTLGIALTGALFAGVFGALIDQVTYSLSEEYYTRMKFIQFAHADFGNSRRMFAGVVGFLGSWWVGLIAAWFLARIAVPVWPGPLAWRSCMASLALMAGTASLAVVIGAIVGAFSPLGMAHWEWVAAEMEIRDVAAFAWVAHIHLAAYLGGLAGFGAAIIQLNGWKKRAFVRRIENAVD